MNTELSPVHNHRVGIAAEFFPDGGTIYDDIGLAQFDAWQMPWQALESEDLTAAPGAQSAHSLLVLRQRVTEEYLQAMPDLLHVARWGAGLDRIDLDACTERGVLVTTTPEGGRRPVASAALALLLALAHQIPARDRIVREARWADRNKVMGLSVADMTIGIIGLGTIGAEFARLVAPFGADLVSPAAHTRPEAAAELGVRRVEFDELLATADAVVLTCPLTAQTRGLISAEALAAMKSTAVLVNVARGGVVDEPALIEALEEGVIAAAGLDVFATEPLPADSPLIGLQNVILAPHSLAWGPEIVDGNRRQALASIYTVAGGGIPEAVANPAVLAHPRWSVRA
ncbi:MAG TPA: dehydrogenase [Candidatus Ruania gallistercoris]|uniref:Dehydrogenase n=1 Tax=Candidatus Ruania gallistercoris TaxID=2838746 RepID=A0A9D2J477_9MICO|nr:dehydrogenase [Candidatus Ruania gallistercoris]